MESYRSVWDFNYLVLLPSDSVSRTKVAFCRSGSIVRFDDFPTDTLGESLPLEAERELSAPMPEVRRDWQYDEFSLVAGYLLHPLKSVEVVRMDDLAQLQACLRKRARQPATTD